MHINWIISWHVYIINNLLPVLLDLCPLVMMFLSFVLILFGNTQSPSLNLHSNVFLVRPTFLVGWLFDLNYHSKNRRNFNLYNLMRRFKKQTKNNQKPMIKMETLKLKLISLRLISISFSLTSCCNWCIWATKLFRVDRGVSSPPDLLSSFAGIFSFWTYGNDAQEFEIFIFTFWFKTR